MIDLVDGDEDGPAGLPQPRRDFAIQRHDAILDIDDEDDRFRRLDRDGDLIDGGAGDDVVRLFAVLEANSAGVHERVGLAQPLRFHADAISGHSRLVMDDGDALSDDAVEQGRFPNIGPTDDGNDSGHPRSMGAAPPGAKKIQRTGR